jgi:Ca2+-binding EF-hand superfamily protein
LIRRIWLTPALNPTFSFTAASIEAARAAEKAQQVQAVFAKFDTNDDGVVSYEELVDGLKKQFKADSLDEAAVKRLFSDLDKDGNDVIDASEFKLR